MLLPAAMRPTGTVIVILELLLEEYVAVPMVLTKDMPEGNEAAAVKVLPGFWAGS